MVHHSTYHGLKHLIGELGPTFANSIKKQKEGWIKKMKTKKGIWASLRVFGPLLTLALSISWLTLQPSSAASYNVTIDPTVTYQTLEGFGAATAWYADWIPSHPNKAELYDVLFKDLGLDIIRFRNTYGSRNGEAFAPAEAEILKGAKSSLGHDIKVLLCSWSPPDTMKKGGVLRGGTLAKVDGAFVYDDFAQYWYDSLVAYAEKGINPDYISIQNEPDFESTDWETCIFRPTETSDYPGYGTALNAVYNKVKTLANAPKFIGPETAGMESSSGSYTDKMDLSQVYGIAHHLYNGGYTDSPDTFLQNMQKYNTLYADKPIFQTEYDQGTPLNTALLIMNSLVTEGVSSYFYWDLIWEHGQRPLVELDNPNDTSNWWNAKGFTITEWYYVFKHFCKFTDPGYKRVAATSDSSNIKTTAFISPDQKQISVVLINKGSSENSVALNLKGINVADSAIYRSIPNGSEKFIEIGPLGSDNTVTLPANSIATVVISTDGSIPSPSVIPSATPSVTPSPVVSPTPSASAIPTLTPSPATTPVPSASSTPGCTVTYNLFSWGNGGTVAVSITNNTATAINGWKLAWNFSGDEKITNFWSAGYTQSGTAVTVANESWNSTIGAGETLTFGFTIAYSGSSAKPSSFTLNGVDCQIK